MNEIEILEQNAIDAAINYRWDEAIKLNKKILVIDKKNIAALLRLAFGYFQTESFPKAKKIYYQVLKLQPTSPVAKDNLERIKILTARKIKKGSMAKISFNPELFLESTGKTKTVKLVNLGQKNVLAQLMIGQPVGLKTKKRKVEVRTETGEYIGSLPDDLSKRLRLFIKADSQYSAYIKESGFNGLTIFIKEEKKGRKVINFLSFPVDLSTNINQIGEEIDKNTETEEEVPDDSSELDLEKIAEALSSEEKEAIPYEPEEPDDE